MRAHRAPPHGIVEHSMEIFMTRTLLLAFLLALFITSPSVNAASVNLGPDFEQLKLVTQLPAEAPRRVSSIAYDGEKLWAGIYMGQGIYATLGPFSIYFVGVWNKKNKKMHIDGDRALV